jgi:hypothetical protein
MINRRSALSAAAAIALAAAGCGVAMAQMQSDGMGNVVTSIPRYCSVNEDGTFECRSALSGDVNLPPTCYSQGKQWTSPSPERCYTADAPQ